MPKLDTVVEGEARPYGYYGVDLYGRSSRQVHGDCPFCGKEGRFYVNIEDGRWDCKKCSLSGNLTTFIRHLWERSTALNSDLTPLAKERPPLTVGTLAYWGVVKSMIDGSWLIPGYTMKGEIGALYKWARPYGAEKNRLCLPPSPDDSENKYGHYPSGCGPAQFVPDRDTVWLTEGFWDGAALWQALDTSGMTANVVSIPGCNVFKSAWCTLFAEKNVILAPHNDHKRERPPAGSGRYFYPGFDGMKKAAGMMSVHTPPVDIRCLFWSGSASKQCDESRPDGFDLRDYFARRGSVDDLMAMVAQVPDSWMKVPIKEGAVQRLEPKPCQSWKVLVASMEKAFEWRQCLQDVFAVMLAVCISTDRAGDQLFLQVVGAPGSLKTKMCDAILVSKGCKLVDNLKGFFSGWKGEGGKDCSLLSRANHKTMVTPEADTIMSSPQFPELMGQLRRIFDGTVNASYKNSSTEKHWTNLRTPWIMAGTPHRMLETEQSSLGDRFLRVVIAPPTKAEQDAILRRVCFMAMDTAKQEANGVPESHGCSEVMEAMRVAGGYVDYLRDNAGDLVAAVKYDRDKLGDTCSHLGRFVADLRARPSQAKKGTSAADIDSSKEEPNRVAFQLTRLAIMLAAVTQEYEADSNTILRIVAKVAFDTAIGKTMSLARFLYERGAGGARLNQCSMAAKTGDQRTTTLLYFLREIDVVEVIQVKQPACRPVSHWRLTARHRSLWDEVMALV